MTEPAAVRAALDQVGWALLPSVGEGTLETLRSIVDRAGAGAVKYRAFEELWDCSDRDAWRDAMTGFREALTPFVRAEFPGYRAVMFNYWLKRALSPHTELAFHRDPSAMDERGGRVALQLWIPLVDVDPTSGSLILVSGSHRTGPAIRHFGYRDPLADHPVTRLPENGVQVTLRAGEGVVFTNRTLHGSTANASEHDRPAVGAILVPDGEPVVAWLSPEPQVREVYTMTDEQFLDLRPGSIPAGAVLKDRIELP